MNLDQNTLKKIKEINNILLIKNPKLSVIKFINDEFKGQESRVIVKCKEHGLGCKFRNPWNPTYVKLKEGKGCPKCSKVYKPTKEEAITDINNKLINTNSDLEVIGFVDDEYKGLESRVIIKCKIHGKGCDFDNPWNPSYHNLKLGYGCPKCSKTYVPTTIEAITEINNKLKNTNLDLEVFGFVEGEYKNSHSRVIIKCKIHGKGCDFDNPWNPSYSKLKEGKSCPKCVKTYKPITEEAITDINNQLLNTNSNLEFFGFVEGEYKNSYSRVILECKIHGKGCDFDNPWNPTYIELKSGRGCPICSVEKNNISKLLKNPIYFNSKRNIYFITFKNLKNNDIFYKIGVSTEKGCKKRFRQKKDNIEIIEAKEITTNNITALLTEYYVLNTFSEYRKPMYHILKHNKGGSECFSYDLTKILTLQEMIDNSINNFDDLIKNLSLTEKEIINTKKEFNKFIN